MDGRTSATRTRDPHHVKFVPLPAYLIDFINYQHDFNAHLTSISATSEIKYLASNSGKDFYKFETRGFEATASFLDANKNNHLAITQNQKTTSNSLKTPVSAYSLHTLALVCILFLSGCTLSDGQFPRSLNQAPRPLTIIVSSDQGVVISDSEGVMYSYDETFFFAQTIMASDLVPGDVLGIKNDE